MKKLSLVTASLLVLGTVSAFAQTPSGGSSGSTQGSGSRRRYTYRDLLELKAIKNLLDAGIRLESVREVFRYLRDNLGEDVTTVNLVISGNQSVLVRSGEEIIDLLRQGQGVLNILPLAGVKDEVDAAIIQLFPAHAEALHVDAPRAAAGGN